MATFTKLEFLVQMSCQSCADAVHRSLDNVEGIKKVHIDLDKERVVIETQLPSLRVKELLESTGRRAVLQGSGSDAQDHLGAAVAMMSGGTVQGVTRLVQVNEHTCAIDGTLDGLAAGQHGLFIHELGDISEGCQSCGEVFESGEIDAVKNMKYGDLGPIMAGADGRAEFRMETARVKVWDIIGRSMIVHEGVSEQNRRLACGIIARSAGLFENTKRICACDGVTLWDERDRPIAGPGRRQDDQAQL